MRQTHGSHRIGRSATLAGLVTIAALASLPGDGAATTPPRAKVPDTILKTHPRAKVKTRKSKARVSFGFTSDVASATFQCKLDNAPYKPCSSPRSYKVKPGKHKFSVWAVGPGGAPDRTLASFSFKVVKVKD